MILVTGAAGKTGRAVLQALLARGEPVRALVRRPDQTAALKYLGVQQVLVGDQQNGCDVEVALVGARGIYHIPPNVSPDELSIGRTVILAARSAGVERFVFHSVLHPQIQSMPHHWQKLLVEEQLLGSGLPFTILQPAVYMQNILAQRESILEQGIYPVPYPAETRLSYVALEDIAEAAAIVLTEPGHEYATYALAGTFGRSQIEVAETLSRITSRPVTVETDPLSEWARQARAQGLGDYQVETLVDMFHYYAQHGLPGNPQVLGWLLGRPPTNMDTCLQAAFCLPVTIDHRNSQI